RALAPGMGGVAATLGEVLGSTSINVTPATLVSLELSPPSATLAPGTQAQLQALGHFSDGTVQDVTASAQWSSSATNVATVLAGRVSAVAAGSAQVQAALLGQT